MTEKESALEKQMYENSLAFFGAITASVTHELNNYIAIVDQTSGLLSDLLDFSEGDIVLKRERLEKIVEKINRNTARSVNMLKQLNTFAHYVDHPNTEFEINAMVDNFYQLTQRFARMKKVELHFEKSAEIMNIISNPFIIQEILIYYFRILLENSLEDSEMKLALTIDSAMAMIELGMETGDIIPMIGTNEYIEMLLNKIRSEINIDQGESALSIKMKIPADY